MSEFVCLGDFPLVQGPRSFVADWLRPVLGAADHFSVCDVRDTERTEAVLRTLLALEPDRELFLVDIWGGIGEWGTSYDAGTRLQGKRAPLLPVAQRVYAEEARIPGRAGGYATDVFLVAPEFVPEVVDILRTQDYGCGRILLHAPRPTPAWYPLLRIMQMLEFATKEFAGDQYSPIRAALLSDPPCWHPLMHAFVQSALRWGIVPYLGLSDHDTMKYILVPGTYADLAPHLLDLESDRGLVTWMTRYVYETGANGHVFAETDDV